MRRLTLLLALLLVLAPRLQARDDVGDALDGLSGASALAYVKELTSKEMKGRRTGFPGGQVAENWIIQKLSEFGLHPADAGGTYLEPFNFEATSVTQPIVMKIGDAALAYGRDYVELTQTGGGGATAEVVFCGYGIHRPDLGWDDYDGVDVDGKIVMALAGAPRSRAAAFKEERLAGYKSATAARQGAAGLLLVGDGDAHGGAILPSYVRPKMPAVRLSARAADRILARKDRTLAELRREHDADNSAKSLRTRTTVTLDVKVAYLPRALGHNALGHIRGRDPDLVNEVVLVGAHMDHFGVAADGSVFVGADDNASGTAVLTHLVDLLTANRWRPKRTIVFCGFGGESQGLIGARALAERYPFEGDIVCMISLDMVGQGEPAVRLSGGGAYPAMTKRLRSYVPQELRGRTGFAPQAAHDGDHVPFHERGIPAYFVTTKGEHPNYRTSRDVAENIDAKCLEAAARTIGTLVVRLGNTTDRLADPSALPGMLLRETPRPAMAEYARGYVHLTDPGISDPRPVPAADAATLRAEGISVLLVRVSEREGARNAWTGLERLAANSNGTLRLVRRASDISTAHEDGGVALLPVLECHDALMRGPDNAAVFAQMGYRILRPWKAGANMKPTEAVVRACVAAGVLVDVLGLESEHWSTVRRLLGTWPAVSSSAVGHGELGIARRLGRATLRLCMGPRALSAALGAPAGMPPGVAVSWETGALTRKLAQWAADEGTAWADPAGEARRDLRAALGGRLAEWLQRAER